MNINKRPSARIARIAEQIHHDIALIIRTLRDPRVNWLNINITEVELVDNYSVAKIYYSLLLREEQKTVNLAFTAATGFIRSVLAKQAHTYTIPKLIFIFDTGIERTNHVLRLLDTISNTVI